MHVILEQGVSNSNVKGQTEAMHLIQCPPPLFGHGYSRYSLLPLGNSLFHIQIGFLPQSLPLEVECAQNRNFSLQLLACQFLCGLGSKHSAIGKNCLWLILSAAACTNCLKLTLSCTKSNVTCWGSDEVRRQTSQCGFSRMQYVNWTKKIQSSSYFLPPQHSEQQHPSQNWNNFLF